MASPAQGNEGNRALGAVDVANAAGAVISHTLLGAWLGVAIGLAAFLVEKSAGWLDGSGWAGAATWLLLPLYIAAGGAALGYAGFWSGIRKAARVILIDSGALRRMVARMLARARKAAEATPDAPDAEDAPARGWVGTKVAAIGRAMARTIALRLGAAAAPDADTGPQVDRIADELIGDVGFVPSIIALVLLAATLAVAPLALG